MPRLFSRLLIFALEMRIENRMERLYILPHVFRTVHPECGTTFVSTLRLKVKPEAYSWLNAAAVEVNLAWNFANETSARAARPFAGPPKWLSAYDLDKLTAGAAEYFEHIGSATIQRVNAEFATRRRQFKKTKLKWRISRGPRKSLGWVPYKVEQLKRQGKCLRFCGKSIRVFEQERLNGKTWKCGCFAQDAVGDWWLCMPVEHSVEQTVAPKEVVGIDLGLRETAATSDGDRLEAGRFYRNIEQKIAQAQCRGHKRQVKRLHRRAARRRKNALHEFSTKIVWLYQNIVVGDVSSLKLVRTPMAKSVLDSGWGILKTQMQYKGRWASRSVFIVNEANTTKECSNCHAFTGPAGLDMLFVKTWICRACGVTHDRNVNSGKNIASAWRSSTSVRGNKLSPPDAPPSQVSRLREARISARTAAA
jgi:putative transposase